MIKTTTLSNGRYDYDKDFVYKYYKERLAYDSSKN